jgi:peptidyl-Asp metalloendopeptidase
MSRRKRQILDSILGAVLFLVMTVTVGFASNGLFRDVGSEEVSALSDEKMKSEPVVIRSRYVRIDFDFLKKGLSPEGDRSIVLNFFEDVSFEATWEQLEERSSTSYTWFGRVIGAGMSELIMVVKDGAITGNIVVDGEIYQIRPVDGGIHVIREIDQGSFPDEAPPIAVHNSPDLSEPLSAAPDPDDGSLIDVLVVYTATAAAASSDIMAEIQLAVDETNQSYSNSGINQKVRLVHAAQVDYTETGKSTEDLARLQNPNNGYLDDVHSMRNTYGADLVSLWVENLDACGIGYLMTNVSPSFRNHAFSVVARDCATGYYSFAHEMGHNMGANHDRYISPGKGAYSYSHGYVFIPRQWRTIMAYNNECSNQKVSCTRIPYWSNPSVNYEGNPTGIFQRARDSANNVLTLNNTAHTVANFRASVVSTLKMEVP